MPYKGGGQVVTDAAGGQFELFTTNPSPAANGQRTDAEGHASRARRRRTAAAGVVQDVPTLAELGFPEANMTSTFGIFAPAKVPSDIINRLHAEIAKPSPPDMTQRLTQLDNVPAVMNPPSSPGSSVRRIGDEREDRARAEYQGGLTAGSCQLPASLPCTTGRCRHRRQRLVEPHGGQHTATTVTPPPLRGTSPALQGAQQTGVPMSKADDFAAS